MEKQAESADRPGPRPRHRLVCYAIVAYALFVTAGIVYVEAELLMHRAAIAEVLGIQTGQSPDAACAVLGDPVAEVSGTDMAEVGLAPSASDTARLLVFRRFEASAFVGLDDGGHVTEKWVTVAGIDIGPTRSAAGAITVRGGVQLMLLAALSGLIMANLAMGSPTGLARHLRASRCVFAGGLGYFIVVLLWPLSLPWHAPQLGAAVLAGMLACLWQLCVSKPPS